MAEGYDVNEIEAPPAVIEVGDAGVVGVPVSSSDATARMAQIEIAEGELPAEPEAQAPAPAKKKTRKAATAKTADAGISAEAAAAAVVVTAAAVKGSKAKPAPPADDLSELEASVAALKSGVDALEGPAEMKLPGAQDAAKVSAELAALKPAAPKRQRKPAKMSLPVAYIAAVGEVDAAKLNEVGVRTTEDLLTRGATRQGRQEIASQTGIDAKLILTWVNHVDLYRVHGVGEEFAQLLEASGVDTVVELAQRNPTNLQAKLVEVNETKQLVRQVAVQSQVARWIEEAKTLPRVVKY
jgi:predicted flap endonuclease-1-like 5' DNA nuclease